MLLLRNTLLGGAASTGPCPTGWTDVESKCLRVFTDTHKTWDDASLACKAEGGRLAQITSSTINDWISGESGGMLWFGGHADANRVWTYDDGTSTPAPMVYTNWYTGQPDNYEGGCLI